KSSCAPSSPISKEPEQGDTQGWPRWFTRIRPQSGTRRPDRVERVAEMVRRCALVDRWLVPPTRLTEVVGHDRTPLGVAGVQPACDRLGGEAPIGERAGKGASGTNHAGKVAEYGDRVHEIVDRHATHRGVE